MSEVKYEMKPVKEKQRKKSQSIFDPVIDAFLESGHDLVEVSFENREPSYMVTQLKKRIERRELDIEVSNAKGFVYLEKKKLE